MKYEFVPDCAGHNQAMDTFTAIVFGGIAVAALTFLALGYAWRDQPVDEVTDRKENERWATQMKVEERDIPEMLDAANEYRRKRGMGEITAEDFGARVEGEQRQLLRQAEKQLAARAR
jgi:hypothetical protein